MITYAVTCNYIHLLAVDSGKDVISKSMQLLSGNTGQAYNIRKNRKGAFREDRFYTTAIENGVHLLRGEIYTGRLAITGNYQLYLPTEIQKMLEGSGRIRIQLV